MKGWQLEQAEKAIVHFAVGLSEDASDFERRNYRKYGTVAGCIKQIEYDMQHGVQERKNNIHFNKDELIIQNNIYSQNYFATLFHLFSKKRISMFAAYNMKRYGEDS
jgi:hypothetical protein